MANLANDEFGNNHAQNFNYSLNIRFTRNIKKILYYFYNTKV